MTRLLLICVLLLLAAGTAAGQEAPVATADRTEIFEGESFQLEIQAPNADESVTPDLSGISDADIVFLGSRAENRFQLTIINGRRQRQGFSGRYYYYEITPRRRGPFRAGPLALTIRNRAWPLEGPVIEVREIPRQDFCTVHLDFAPREIVPDETFTASVLIRIRRLPAPYSDVEPWNPDDPLHLRTPFLDAPPTDGLEYPDMPTLLNARPANPRAPGFRINNYAADFFGRPAKFALDRTVVETNGLSWFEYRLAIPIRALEEGGYTFGPVSLKGQVITAVTPDRRPVFSPLYVVASDQTLTVRAPPVENRPPFFFGLTGSNLVADAQLDTQNCRVGDPVRLTLHISGPLNWRYARVPDLAAQPALAGAPFQLYPNTVQTRKTETGREYTFLFRPLEAGTFEFPSLAMCWFDLATRTYQTAHTLPIPLKAEPASEWTDLPWAAAGETEAAESAAARLAGGRVPAGFRFNPAGAVSHRLPAAGWVLAVLGPLAALVALLFQAVRRFRTARNRTYRARTAVPRAERRLRAALNDAAADSRETARALYLLMRDLAGDLAEIESNGLTPPDAAQALLDRGVPEPDARAFEADMRACFEAAYNPSAAPLDAAAWLERLPPHWRRIHRHIRPRGTNGSAAPGALLLLAAVLLTPAAARADDRESRRHFAWEEAQSLAAHARTAPEFRAAAARYERLAAETGLRNGNLFYNWGLCLLMAGEPGPAWSVFVRAERYLGRPADLAHNMAVARQALDGPDSPPVPWNRILLWPHFGIPWRLRALIGSAAFATLWLFGWLLHRRESLARRVLAAAAALIFLFFATSAALTGVQEHRETSTLAQGP